MNKKLIFIIAWAIIIPVAIYSYITISDNKYLKEIADKEQSIEILIEEVAHLKRDIEKDKELLHMLQGFGSTVIDGETYEAAFFHGADGVKRTLNSMAILSSLEIYNKLSNNENKFFKLLENKKKKQDVEQTIYEYRQRIKWITERELIIHKRPNSKQPKFETL